MKIPFVETVESLLKTLLNPTGKKINRRIFNEKSSGSGTYLFYSNKISQKAVETVESMLKTLWKDYDFFVKNTICS